MGERFRRVRLFFEGVAGVADSAPGSSSTSSCSSPLSASSASQIFLASRLSSSRSSSSLSPSAAVGSKRVLELFRRADLSALRTIGAPVPPFILRGFLTGVEAILGHLLNLSRWAVSTSCYSQAAFHVGVSLVLLLPGLCMVEPRTRVRGPHTDCVSFQASRILPRPQECPHSSASSASLPLRTVQPMSGKWSLMSPQTYGVFLQSEDYRQE